MYVFSRSRDNNEIKSKGDGLNMDSKYRIWPAIFSLALLISTAHCVKTEDGKNETTGPNSSQPELLSTFGRGSYGTDGEINFPSGIAVDNNGNVYVCEAMNKRISKFNVEGVFLNKWFIKDCLGVDTDNDNNVYVANVGQNKVIKYDSNGVLIQEWGSYGSGDGQFNAPRDIAVNKKLGIVYVADSSNCRIQAFDVNGNFVNKWGVCGEGDSQFSSRVYGIAVDQNSNSVYVADSGHTRIQKFDQNGNFLLKWGSGGKEEGQIRWDRGIAVDSNGYVYEADTDNERIQVFDSSGNFIRTFRGLHSIEKGPFHPRAVTTFTDPQSGAIFVFAAAGYANRIDKFDSSGNFITTWGWWEKDKGVLNNPGGMALDNLNGYIYVADTWNFLIQKFDTDGNFIKSWGYSGRVYTQWTGGDGSFDFPTSVTTDNEGNVYVLRPDSFYGWDDPELRRVQKFDRNGNLLSS